MHLFLTDRLSCPRCGPEFGLILLARDVREKRVFHGDFGCSNCREAYPVVDGFADLRMPPRVPLPAAGPPGEAEEVGTGAGHEEALRLAALMGVAEGPGTLLLMGPAALQAPGVRQLVNGIEVVGIHQDLRFQSQVDGVSRMISGPGIPFFSGTFLGVVVSGEQPDRAISEAARVVSPLGRVVVTEARSETRGLLESGGLEILVQEAGVLVASRPRGLNTPLVTLRGP